MSNYFCPPLLAQKITLLHFNCGMEGESLVGINPHLHTDKSNLGDRLCLCPLWEIHFEI